MLRRCSTGLACLTLAGCAVVSGPCEVEAESPRVECDEGGRVVIVRPAETIRATVKAKDETREHMRRDR
jgi:hypothetical protein